MTCFICGTEKNISRNSVMGRSICRECNKDTPPKVNRELFDRLYWGQTEQAKQVPEGIKREFYSDYLASTHNVKEYKAATTTEY